MTTRLHCDGPDCTTVMDADAHHIALNVEGAPPVIEMDDDGNEYGILELKGLGFSAETHLCSMACLASWAMSKHLDAADGAA